jgi:broad specificity phosphatase PhoE
MSAATVTEIYLVRHGETDWNREQRLQGRIDTPLNGIGLAQARQVAYRFRALTGTTVVTSPLARARNTARAIARGNHSALVIDPLLAEIDHGSWTGLTLPTIDRACPGAVLNGQVHTAALHVSGGETLAAAYCRASSALQRLVSSSRAAPVVVVSHGVTNALVMCAAVGIDPAHMNRYTQPNGCAYRLSFRRRVLITVECAPLAASFSNALAPYSFAQYVNP